MRATRAANCGFTRSTTKGFPARAAAARPAAAWNAVVTTTSAGASASLGTDASPAGLTSTGRTSSENAPSSSAETATMWSSFDSTQAQRTRDVAQRSTSRATSARAIPRLHPSSSTPPTHPSTSEAAFSPLTSLARYTPDPGRISTSPSVSSAR
jgi:hypothetical protein